MTSWYNERVVCPYYRWDNGKDRIGCEAICPTASSTTITFLRHRAFEDQMQIFCCEAWHNCELAEMLNKIYGEGKES